MLSSKREVASGGGGTASEKQIQSEKVHLICSQVGDLYYIQTLKIKLMTTNEKCFYPNKRDFGCSFVQLICINLDQRRNYFKLVLLIKLSRLGENPKRVSTSILSVGKRGTWTKLQVKIQGPWMLIPV